MHLDWSFFLQDDGSGRSYLEWMLEAWQWTLAVAGAAWLVALSLGAVAGTLRTLPGRLVPGLALAWVEVFRNIPVLVQVLLWYFVAPKLIPSLQHVSGFVLVVVALGCFTSARIAEQVRAGIQSLPRGQLHAARALGLSPWQCYRHVILPQALRTILPPLTSEAMNLLKNSSVAFAVSIPELTQYAMQVQEETARGIEVYLAVTGLYVASALVVNRIMVWLEKRLRLPGSQAATSEGH